MIPYIELLSLVGAFLFIIYGLERAVVDKDDLMILLGVLVQIGVISGITFWISEITNNRSSILLIGVLSIVGVYPVLQGIRRNLVLPSEIQIEIESSLDEVDPGPFRQISNPQRMVTKNEGNDD